MSRAHCSHIRYQANSVSDTQNAYTHTPSDETHTHTHAYTITHQSLHGMNYIQKNFPINWKALNLHFEFWFGRKNRRRTYPRFACGHSLRQLTALIVLRRRRWMNAKMRNILENWCVYVCVPIAGRMQYTYLVYRGIEHALFALKLEILFPLNRWVRIMYMVWRARLGRCDVDVFKSLSKFAF